MQTQKKNYYDILGVERDASQSEIKKAFRRMAKKYHPDTNREDSKQEASRRMKQIMAAYRVLNNERERARYDVLLQTSPAFNEPEETEWDKGVKGQVERMLDCLLQDKGQQAIDIWDELSIDQSFDLEDYLDTRDYLDCLFLLAEELEEVERNREAADLYEELFEKEKEPPRQRYFYEEVEVRLKKLYSRKLPRDATDPNEEIACYERILEFDVDRSEKAFILKKIAEVHLAMGDEEKATEVFEQALDLKPGLKGTATIREKLGFDPAE
ncbi:MAG: DnaJ domain-containing protein [Planctomycetota bacterium]